MNPAYVGYAWCVVSSLFSALATYLIKRSTLHSVDWDMARLCWLAAACGSYVLGFGFYALALQKLQMSLAYPVMTAVTMLLVTIVGYLALGEQITPTKVCGMLLLAAGAWVLAR